MTDKKFLVCYGTRPEYIKLKPLINEMKYRNIKFDSLFTGQHTDTFKAEDFTFKLEMVHSNLNRLSSIISNIISTNINYSQYDYVIVQGDTSTALAIAIDAFNNHVKVIHVEAGLRTYDYDNPFPEEMNRQIISRISSINFCPTENNLNNLNTENVRGECYVVGNTVLDNLINVKTSYNNNILITMHRRENHSKIDKWFLEFNKLAYNYKDLEFFFISHPNPNVINNLHILNNDIKILKHLQYSELIDKLSKCKFVISDSGGLQEECNFLNKKIIVCREFTERQESIDKSSKLCTKPEYLNEIFDIVNKNYDEKCPNSVFGDGSSSKNICNILELL